MTFRNSVVGGTTLVRPAIKSPNFVTGVSGWSIDRSGSAEFNNVTIRGGTVISGTSLYYNGVPAVGNLVASITATAGTDTLGNAYLAGITTYANDGTGLFTQMQTDGDLALGYSSVFPNPAVLGSFFNGLQIASPYKNAAPNDDPVFLVMQPGGTTGADRGYVQFSTGTGLDSDLVNYGTVTINTQETGTTGLIVDAVSGSTASLMSLRVNGTSQLTVDSGGNIVTYSQNTFDTFTPTVTNGGTATFTTQTGYWQRVGKMVFVNIYIVVNAGGSGATPITIALPVTPNRTNRQVMFMHGSGLTTGTGEYTALILTSGSGAVIDTVSRGGTDVTGADLTNADIITIQGWIREV